MSRIFLSHSSKDNFEAIALRDWLASEGWSDVFLDLDPERGIAAGERWERALHDAANRCEAVIFLVSANWLGLRLVHKGICARAWAQQEAVRCADRSDHDDSIAPGRTDRRLADRRSRSRPGPGLFPAELPGSYEERHVGYSQSGLSAAEARAGEGGARREVFSLAAGGEPDRAPYRGLKPQEADDAGIFFGRDAPIVEAIDRLRGLRGRGAAATVGDPRRLGRWQVFVPARRSSAETRARRRAVHSLAGSSARARGADWRDWPRQRARGHHAGAFPRRICARPRRPGRRRFGLCWPSALQAALARRIAGDEAERPPAFVVAIDQAEELFRAEGREESEALLALLADLAAGDDPTVIVIFTIRSDSYDALQSAKALDGLRQVAFSLLPMPRGAYQRRDRRAGAQGGGGGRQAGDRTGADATAARRHRGGRRRRAATARLHARAALSRLSPDRRAAARRLRKVRRDQEARSMRPSSGRSRARTPIRAFPATARRGSLCCDAG